jgi:hypothetical protein
MVSGHAVLFAGRDAAAPTEVWRTCSSGAFPNASG